MGFPSVIVIKINQPQLSVRQPKGFFGAKIHWPISRFPLQIHEESRGCDVLHSDRREDPTTRARDFELEREGLLCYVPVCIVGTVRKSRLMHGNGPLSTQRLQD